MRSLLCVCLLVSLQTTSSLRIREETETNALELPGNVLGDDDDEEREFYVLDDNEDEDEDDDDEESEENLELLEMEGCKKDNKDKTGEAKKTAIKDCKTEKKNRKAAGCDQACKDAKKLGKRKMQETIHTSVDGSCSGKVRVNIKYYSRNGKPRKVKKSFKKDTAYYMKTIEKDFTDPKKNSQKQKMENHVLLVCYYHQWFGPDYHLKSGNGHGDYHQERSQKGIDQSQLQSAH